MFSDNNNGYLKIIKVNNNVNKKQKKKQKKTNRFFHFIGDLLQFNSFFANPTNG